MSSAVEDASGQADLWTTAEPAEGRGKRAATPAPHYLGHRDRLRERAMGGGPAALPDYEVLELLLFRSRPRGDVKPLAKQLLARFGSFSGVLGATVEELKTVAGVGEVLALDLKLLQEAALRMGRDAVGNGR